MEAPVDEEKAGRFVGGEKSDLPMSILDIGVDIGYPVVAPLRRVFLIAVETVGVIKNQGVAYQQKASHQNPGEECPENFGEWEVKLLLAGGERVLEKYSLDLQSESLENRVSKSQGKK